MKGLTPVEQLGKFLGAKLDTIAAAMRSPQNIKVDIGEASKQLENAAKSVTGVAAKLDAAARSQDMGTVKREISKLITSIDTMTKAVGKVEPTDVRPVTQAVNEVRSAVNRIKYEAPKIDLSVLERSMNDLNDAMVESKHSLIGKLNEVQKELNGMGTQIVEAIERSAVKLPKEMRIDQSQIASIVHGGGIGSVTGGEIQPSKVVVTNVAMADADTEYSHTFTKGTVGFRISLRGQGTITYYAWESGVLPVSGDASAYMSLEQNHELVREKLDLGGKTIYMEVPTATQVAEIEEYIIP